MGAGVFGGFGKTLGFEMNRLNHPIPETPTNYEMALNPVLRAEMVVKKFGINLKGSRKKIKIIYNPNLPLGNAGKVRLSNPNVIELGPSAFISESELANTIAHELNHVRDYLRGSIPSEIRAYKSGNTLADYIKGGR